MVFKIVSLFYQIDFTIYFIDYAYCQGRLEDYYFGKASFWGVWWDGMSPGKKGVRGATPHPQNLFQNEEFHTHIGYIGTEKYNTFLIK